jgi:hypothetical protein
VSSLYNRLVSQQPVADCYLPAPLERVHTVSVWLHAHILGRIEEGGMRGDSSIRSRLQAWMSEAMLAYEQCKCATA